MDECDYRTEHNIPCDGDKDNAVCSGYAKCWPMDKETIRLLSSCTKTTESEKCYCCGRDLEKDTETTYHCKKCGVNYYESFV
jgi:tRNA(Ile2) C34 agmatinyltransferase TiaS